MADFRLKSPNTSTGAAATAVAVFFSAANFAGTSAAYMPASGTADFPPAQPGANFYGSSAAYTPPNGSADFSATTPVTIPAVEPPPDFIVTAGMPWARAAGRTIAPTATWSAASAASADIVAPWGDAADMVADMAAPWRVTRLQPSAMDYTPPAAISADLDMTRGTLTQDGMPITGPADFRGTSAAYAPPAPADFRAVNGGPPTGIIVAWSGQPPEPGGYARNSSAAAPWGTATPADAALGATWASAQAMDQAVAELWGAGVPRDKRQPLRWDEASAADAGRITPWDAAAARDQDTKAPWDVSGGVAVPAPGYTPPPATAADLALTSGANFAGTSAAYTPPSPADFSGPNGPALGDSIAVFFVAAQGQEITEGKSRAVDQSIAVPWGKGQARDVTPSMDWATEDPAPGDGLPDTVPIQESYTVASTCTVVRLPERTPINIISATAGLNMGDFTWSARIALADQAGLDLINPSSGVKEVELEINGFAIWLIVESWSRQTLFRQTTWVANCRGISAELDAPYFVPRDHLSTSAATASQLALDELAGTGWTRTWSATDWTLQAGDYFYHDRTPIRAIAALADTAGAFVMPAANAKALTISSRLPHKPSDWPAQTPDAIIPQSITTQLSDDWKPAPTYNYVQVSGGTQGVTVEATKQGTPGSLPAPDIVDPYTTAQTVGQERARVELYSSGNAASVSRQLPIMAGLGVRLPGELIRNDDDAGQWFGLVTGVQLSGAWDSEGLKCWQTLTQDRRDL